MNIHDAAHATIHDYPGGAASLAPRLGMVQAVLNSKVNPNTHTHHLTLAEALRVMVMTGDHRILGRCAPPGAAVSAVAGSGCAAGRGSFVVRAGAGGDGI